MIAGRARVLNVVYAVDAARQAHPELEKPLTPKALWRVLAREGVDVVRRRIRQRARVSSYGGAAVIFLHEDLSPREAWKYAAHEWGHVLLHFPEHGEHERQLSPCRRGDPREDEAALFARLLLLGAEATIDHPDVAPLAGRIVAKAYRAALPPQIPLPLPYVPPPAAPKLPPRRGTQRQPPLRGSLIGLGSTHDSLRFDWSNDGKPLLWFSYAAGWCEVWDVQVDPESGKRSVVKVGSRGVAERVFVTTSAERRRYRFQEGETRRRTVAALEEQFARAVRTKPAPRPARAPNSLVKP
ncbi:MAG: ImmA/IrrE family metallo-endopeptidase [Kofleriaceae bacterium]